MAAFAAGFETNPNELRDIDGTADNAYVIRPAADTDELDDETVRRLVRTIDPVDPVEMDITRTDGVVLVDAVVEAPPEIDREASPDAQIRSKFDRYAGTVTFEHVEGEAVLLDELEVWHDGEEVTGTLFDGDEFAPGDEITVETGLIATVMVRWFDPDANVYDTYAREQVDREAFAVDYDMSAETLEISYEAERPADASNLRLVHRGEEGVQTVGEEFTDGTFDPGNAVTVTDVSIGDSVQLAFDGEEPMGGGSFIHYRARPPRVWIHSHAEDHDQVRRRGVSSS
ncbi:hypothetical protein GCM10008994_15000 [Halorubrum ejinorense]|uniref:Uncharacterized protein n=1 Tax=Halorubrum ejinorense TaxID=425309 RepID=A0AAV3SR11_9EURY